MCACVLVKFPRIFNCYTAIPDQKCVLRNSRCSSDAAQRCVVRTCCSSRPVTMRNSTKLEQVREERQSRAREDGHVECENEFQMCTGHRQFFCAIIILMIISNGFCRRLWNRLQGAQSRDPRSSCGPEEGASGDDRGRRSQFNVT